MATIVQVIKTVSLSYSVKDWFFKHVRPERYNILVMSLGISAWKNDNQDDNQDEFNTKRLWLNNIRDGSKWISTGYCKQQTTKLNKAG